MRPAINKHESTRFMFVVPSKTPKWLARIRIFRASPFLRKTHKNGSTFFLCNLREKNPNNVEARQDND